MIDETPKDCSILITKDTAKGIKHDLNVSLGSTAISEKLTIYHLAFHVYCPDALEKLSTFHQVHNCEFKICIG